MNELKSLAFLSGGGEMGALMRGFDWSGTPLDAAAAWPQPLKTLVGVMLVAKQPMFLAWGASRTFLYNDAYAPVLGHKHPSALGRSFHDVWPEIRDDLEPLFDQAFDGEPVHMDDITLFLNRRGRLEETHFAFSYTPVRDATGAVAGLFCPCAETTQQVLAERRQAFRLSLEEHLRDVNDPRTIIAATVQALGRHLGANRVGYGQVQSDDETIVLATSYADGVEQISGAFSLAGFGAESLARYRRGLTVVQDDVTGDSSYDPAVWAEIETRALVSVPLVRNGCFEASLYVNQREPRAWSTEDVALIEEVAKRLWDMVKRAQAEATLRENEAHLAGIFAQTGAGFAETDLDGRFVSVNDHYYALVGRSRQTLLDLCMQEITCPEDLGIYASLLQGAVATGEPFTVEKRYLRADGQIVWVADTVSLISSTGSKQTLLAVAIDITKRKQAERDLAAAKEVAEEANQAKSAFIANMSHELRTPLSAIIGYSEMLQEEIEDSGDPGGITPDMAKIESNARHLLGLINDVLDLSKIESGKMEVYAETFDVEPMLREVASTVQSLMDKMGNQLRLQVAADGLGTMHSDVTKIRQVLLNLLSNAAKFTEGGAIMLSAERGPGPDGTDWFAFRVSDAGIGMTEEQLAKLFQRFQQADVSTTRKFGGTGLGLAITKTFSTMLGGDVEVASTPGQGSTFVVKVPAVVKEPGQVSATQGAQEGQPEHGSAETEAKTDVVLVIDDDPAQRELMSRFLEREGFAVRTAPEGQTGLELAQALRPRAILLDVMMPGMDGWSVLRALKAGPELARIPVVMVTFVDERGLAASLGAADYVLKPVEWERFKTVMDRFCEGDGDVLVVDDDPDARQRLRTVLEKDGWTVMEAGNGQEALDCVAHVVPQVILLDLTMPVMDGFSFLHALRERPGCADIPVVVLTARDLTNEDRRRLRGASQVLSKGETSLLDLAGEVCALAPLAPAEANVRT